VPGEACGSLPIIFRDDNLIAIHKPAGLLAHRSVLDREVGCLLNSQFKRGE